MKTRLTTGIFIIIGLALALASRLISTYIFDFLFTIIGIIACVEVTRAFQKNNKYVPITLSATFPIILYIGLLIGVLNDRPFYFFLIYYLCAIIIYFIFGWLWAYLFRDDSLIEINNGSKTMNFNKFATQKGLFTVLNLIYPGFLLTTMYFINNFEKLSGVSELGDNFGILLWFFIILIFVTSILTDTFAFVVGSMFKGPKLCTKISPNKTISGAVGGVVFSLIGTLGLFLVFNTNSGFATIFESLGGNVWTLIILGVLCSIFTQLGDILASLIKRKCYIKDYGTILPGHGGVMDRIDGQIMNMAFMLVFMCIFIF